MNKQFLLGARPSPEDVRDYSVHLTTAVQFATNFRLNLGKNYNQKVNNCVAQAIRAIWRYIYGTEYGVDQVYGGARSGEYYGLFPQDAANFVVKYGVAPLKSDPNEQEIVDVINYYNVNRTKLEVASAPFKALAWGRPSTISEVKALIASKTPVMVCMPWYAWKTDGLGRLAKTGNLLGYHEVDVIGWQVVSGVEMAVIFNSHDETFGIDGEGFAYWDHVFETGDLIAFTFAKQKVEDEDKEVVTVYPTLRKGMTGEWVVKAQKLLTKKGFECKADGEFGEKTEAAVIAYQKKTWPLKEDEWDGVIGRNTWNALEAEDEEIEQRDTLRLKDPYMHGEDVKTCQKLLEKHGFPCGTIDGVYGKQTQQTVVKFQTAKGLSPDGVVGKKSWAALDAEPTPTPNQTLIERCTKYLKSKLGDIYAWGAQGQVVSAMKDPEAWLKKVETSEKNANRAIALYRKRVAEGDTQIEAYDCSGLIVRFLLDEGLIESDMSSRGLYAACEKITDRSKLQAGDFVFRHNGIKIYHVGVYIGNGLVIESKGRDDGVVMRNIDDSGKSYWNRYGRLGLLK